MKIDAHQHFWKVARGDYHWMDDSVSAIRRDYGPDDWAVLQGGSGVNGSVVVQAAATVEETRYLLGLADRYPSILGVVGWVDLGTNSALSDLDALAQHPRFKGIRPMLQDIDDTLWILEPRHQKVLRRLVELGLRMDALIQPRHLNVIDELAHQNPELLLVIDHCAKPIFDAKGDVRADWYEGMKRLAQQKQICCKLSGLANEFGAGWSAEALKPVAAFILEQFGAARVMWGSDWPVLELAGRYQDWFRCAQELTSDCSDAEQEMIFGGTAARFYGLDFNAE